MEKIMDQDSIKRKQEELQKKINLDDLNVISNQEKLIDEKMNLVDKQLGAELVDPTKQNATNEELLVEINENKKKEPIELNSIKAKDKFINDDLTENLVKTEAEGLVSNDWIDLEKEKEELGLEDKKKDDPDLETIPMAAATVPDDKASKILSEIDILDIDLGSIQIVNDTNLLHRVDLINSVASDSSSYQVIALKSGYVAGMKALVNRDKEILQNSNLDVHETRKQLYRVVYSKMSHTNLGQISFEEFLNITAFDDIETLLFGIFAQTYPGDTEFNVTCGKCKAKSQVKIRPDSFIQTKNKKVFDYVKDVIGQKYKPQELLQYSLVHTTNRFILPVSKIVVDITTPNLVDQLEMLSKYSEKYKNLQTIFGYIIYIKNLYIPNLAALSQGKQVFNQISDFQEKFNLIANLKSEDTKVLKREIGKRESDHNINYAITKLTCPKCKEDMGDINIDMERLLFFLLVEEIRALEKV
jgi:hypothetical protein